MFALQRTSLDFDSLFPPSLFWTSTRYQWLCTLCHENFSYLAVETLSFRPLDLLSPYHMVSPENTVNWEPKTTSKLLSKHIQFPTNMQHCSKLLQTTPCCHPLSQFPEIVPHCLFTWPENSERASISSSSAWPNDNTLQRNLSAITAPTLWSQTMSYPLLKVLSMADKVSGPMEVWSFNTIAADLRGSPHMEKKVHFHIFVDTYILKEYS